MKTTQVLVLLILALSCSKDNCSDLDAKIAVALGNTLECSNIRAIEEDVAKVLPKDCKRQQAGPICVLLVDPVVELALNTGIPKRWECKMTRTKEELKDALKSFCSLV